MGIVKDPNPTFTLLAPPEFQGELETLSVKVPADLKSLLRDIGLLKSRTLSEVVVHALTEYGKHFQAEVKTKTKRRSNN